MRGSGIATVVSGRFPERGALIANHVSYLDILVLASLHPCVFVAKAEIRRWPVIGWLATMAGTVFVERGRGCSAMHARGELRAAAEQGVTVVFFPEGTTSNGREVLRFHSGLLGQVLGEGSAITAAYLRYSLGPRDRAHASAEDDVAYWGERAMLPHVFRFLSLREVRANVRFASAPIHFLSGPNQRKQAAVEAREAVRALAAVESRGEMASASALECS